MSQAAAYRPLHGGYPGWPPSFSRLYALPTLRKMEMLGEDEKPPRNGRDAPRARLPRCDRPACPMYHGDRAECPMHGCRHGGFFDRCREAMAILARKKGRR